MANDLIKAENDATAVITSPELQKLRRLSLGTVQWPDQPMRKYLSGGLTLTPIERSSAENLLQQLRVVAEGSPGRETVMARLALLTKMMLVYPSQGATEAAGQARAEAYLETLGQVAPWAIQRAIHKWNSGDCGKEHDYRWAPAPATLLSICRLVTWQYTRSIEHLEGLLSALTLGRAMDATPIERSDNVKSLVPRMQRI